MFLSDEEYQHVLDLLDGKIEKSPLLVELAAWAMEEFSLKIYDYICDHTNNGLTRLRVIVWDDKAQKAMRDGVNYSKEKQQQFQQKFAALARKYNAHPEYHNENNIFVTWSAVKDQIIDKALWDVRTQISDLKQGDIWKITIIFEQVHIFYETDAQIEQHEQDGSSEALRQKIGEICRRNDKYQVFDNGVSCVFTSHQTLNEKYKGSMFYYTR